MQPIKNIGILAHVDAGKTTVTEQLLYQSGVIQRVGRVDYGSTVTDSMQLERERGITIRASSASLVWNGSKINLVDTPGHMDFIAEVERTFSVLEGAVLVISAREGVQSQTKIIFRHLQRLGIPTLILINKIDRTGADPERVTAQIRSLLTPDIVIMQELRDNAILERPLLHDDIQTSILSSSPPLQARFFAGHPISEERLASGLYDAVGSCALVPVFYGAALKGIGISPLLDAVARWLPCCAGDAEAPFCGIAYKVDRDASHVRRSYVKVLSGALHLRDTAPLSGPGAEAVKITALQRFEGGSAVDVKSVACGDIAILPHVKRLQIGDILGTPGTCALPKPLRHKAVFKASVLPNRPQQRPRLLQALAELAEEDPVLDFALETAGEITIRLLGNTQKEIIQGLLLERYGLPASFGELATVYMERPQKAAEAVIYMGVSPNPFWASVGLRVAPLPIGSGIRLDSEVSAGYLNPSFQNAVRDGALAACRHGLCGWEVTDLRITFFYGKYSSPVSTPADFRRLAPYVMEQALRRAGTDLLEPVCNYTLEVPEGYAGKAMHDIRLMGGSINDIVSSAGSVSLSGTAPEQTARGYSLDVAAYTEGRGVFITEYAGYAPYWGESVHSGWEPDRTDQLRHRLLKLEHTEGINGSASLETKSLAYGTTYPVLSTAVPPLWIGGRVAFCPAASLCGNSFSGMIYRL